MTAENAYNRTADRARATGQEAVRVFRLFVNQPSWVIRLGVVLAAAVMLAMLALLIIPALIVFALVMLIGAAAQRLRTLGGGWFPSRPGGLSRRDREGRRNVRVIVRGQ